MKRFIFFFILLLTVSLTAVQAKTLVVYYSYTGNTSHGYALNGMIAAEGQKGIIIKDGKKVLMK